jgi:TatD DNase family protein
MWKIERYVMVFYDVHSHKLSENENVVTVHSVDLGLKENAVWEAEDVRSRPHELFSAGIHPWNPDTSKIIELKELALLNNVVAIGETGLDKLKYDFEIQKYLFEIQVQMAEEIGKPLIIHCVRAWNELLKIKKHFKPSVAWVIHGFRGGEKLAGQLINAGMYLSFGKNFHPESLRKAWDAKRLFTETDDENIDIQNVYEDISESLNISKEELSVEVATAFRLLVH